MQPSAGTRASRTTPKRDASWVRASSLSSSTCSGFIAYYWIDAGDGVMASLSVFDDKAGADESVRLAHEWVQANAAALIPNPPQVTEGLVVASGTK